MRSRRRRIGWIAGAIGGTLLLSTSPLWGTYLGRKMDWLLVQRVEITGTHLLAAHEVLVTSRVEPGRHILDEFTEAEQFLVEHPAIERAEVTRRLPGTLRIRITEKKPVALLRGEELRLATAGGEILPMPPHAAALDLPVLNGSLADSARADATRTALAETDRLSSLAPWLMRDVSEVDLLAHSRGVLVLSHPDAEILLPNGVGDSRLEELRRVLLDVEKRFGPAAAGKRRHQIDLRYEGQVVVRPSSYPERS